jgi:type VI secretion system protein VasG
MQIVPFFPLLGDPLAGIVRLKLGKLARQLRESQRIGLTCTDAVVAAIADRCTEVETGARNIDHIINRTLRPEIATEILSRMGEDAPLGDLLVDVGPDGRFSYAFAGDAPPAPAAEAPASGDADAEARAQVAEPAQ